MVQIYGKDNANRVKHISNCRGAAYLIQKSINNERYININTKENPHNPLSYANLPIYRFE